MQNIFFASREKARNAAFGKLVDFGSSAPKGERYARQVSLSGNAKQRRIAFRKMLRQGA